MLRNPNWYEDPPEDPPEPTAEDLAWDTPNQYPFNSNNYDALTRRYNGEKDE